MPPFFFFFFYYEYSNRFFFPLPSLRATHHGAFSPSAPLDTEDITSVYPLLVFVWWTGTFHYTPICFNGRMRSLTKYYLSLFSGTEEAKIPPFLSFLLLEKRWLVTPASSRRVLQKFPFLIRLYKSPFDGRFRFFSLPPPSI